jgi:hypothetical protein
MIPFTWVTIAAVGGWLALIIEHRGNCPPGGTACLALAGITQGVYELDRHSWIAGGICLGLGVLFGLSAMGNVQRQQDAAGTDGKPE